MEKLNFEGISSISLENIKETNVTDKIKQFILWEGENGKHTAIYKFDKNAKLPFIDHHEKYDEHIYVMDGVFNDGENDYKKGSYIINPKGTAHQPQSVDGCTFLVTFP